MTKGRRLLAVGAVLALGAAICSAPILGEPTRDKDHDRWQSGRDRPDAAADRMAEDMATSRFTDTPVVTYRSPDGATWFGLQVQPDLPAAPPRPRDFLVLLDTSASQARGPLVTAIQLTKALVGSLGAEDRVAILTANVHAKDLTRGLQHADKARAALKALEGEYPAGATNLNEALHTALKTFDGREGRQRVLLFLGDGLSLRDPITPGERAALAADMVRAEVAFFPVPLGDRLDPQTLHGFASATGGVPVRARPHDRIEDILKRLQDTVAAPILYPQTFALQGDVTESLPAQLPPLRGDSPTLVVGKLRGGDQVGYRVTGTVAGAAVTKAKAEKLPAPELENFFLVSMAEQWRRDRDAPALIRADRALAYALEQNQLARADLLAQAEWAVSQDQWDAAAHLFAEAARLDPASAEAKAGTELLQKLRDGKMTKDQLLEQVRPKADDTVFRIKKGEAGPDGARVQRERLLAHQAAAPAAAPPAAGAPPAAPSEAPADLLREARERQAVEDQRVNQEVDQAIRQATDLLRRDPDAAHDLLRRWLDTVRTNPDLSERVRQTLAARLQANLQAVDTQGTRIKQDMEQRVQALARAQEIRATEAARESTIDRVRERMRVFHNLMNEAREEEAQRQAQAIRQDLVNQGLPVPPAVTAGYIVAENGHNLREELELVRIRQDRWMATLLQVEKSGVPFPDEPPVAYPPAAAWREITRLRKERYESSGLGPDTPRRTLELRDKLSQPVTFSGIDQDPKMTLQEALDLLADRYDLTFDVNEAAFKAEMVEDVLSKPVAEKAIPKMTNVSLDTVLRKILARIPSTSGTTYLIRRDSIEITTGAYALAEKTLRVYPVADLVIPIPSAFNAQAVGQSSILGLGGLGALGSGVLQLGGNPLQGLGGLGALGALGGGLGALGGGLGALGALGGGLGALGGAGGGLGALGGGLGAQGGVIGALGGQANLGFGGGVAGFGGGQLGQLGNLGGQFGLQGGNQSALLIRLIRQVIGTPRDWAPLRGVNTFGLPDQNNQMDDPNSDPLGNDLGFFPPAMALVVKGTSRIHTNNVAPLIQPNAPPAGMGRLGGPDRDGIVRVDGHRNGGRKPETQVAGAGDHVRDKIVRPKLPLADADPKTVWQEALSKGVDDPGLIIATADYLVEAGRFDHAAEFLKANLRLGIVVRPWVYEALAICLRQSGASPDEVERAELSAADLQPLDAGGFVKAAKGAADGKHLDAALAFCRQAAALQPDVSYAYEDALTYAARAKDAGALEWAASNLLRRDWPVKNDDLHARARSRLTDLVRQMQARDPARAELLRAELARDTERDVVLRLTWSGPAELDLKVREPSGSVCSCLNRQTVGGGSLIGGPLDRRKADRLGGFASAGDDTKTLTYVAAQAFRGDYRVTVETVWGHPLGGKAKLEVIEHQGTPRETVRLVTLDLAVGRPTVVKVEEGRRTELASVPPPAAQRHPDPVVAAPAGGDVLSELRAMTDRDSSGGLRGDLIGFGVPTAATAKPVLPRPPKEGEAPVGYQTRLSSFVRSGADLTAQATLSPDGRSVRLSVEPVFNTYSRMQQAAQVNNPLIPGGSGR